MKLYPGINYFITTLATYNGTDFLDSYGRTIRESDAIKIEPVCQPETTTTNKTANLKKEGEVQIAMEELIDQIEPPLEFDSLTRDDLVEQVVQTRYLAAPLIYTLERLSTKHLAAPLIYTLERLSTKPEESEGAHKALEEFCGQKINRVERETGNLKAEDLMSKPEPKIDMKEGSGDSVKTCRFHNEPKLHDALGCEKCQEGFRKQPTLGDGCDKLEFLPGGAIPVRFPKEPKSIWKPATDLSKEKDLSHAIIKHGSLYKFSQIANDGENLGFFGLDGWIENYEGVESYCLLNDFINSFESEQKARLDLEERVRKLEGVK